MACTPTLTLVYHQYLSGPCAEACDGVSYTLHDLSIGLNGAGGCSYSYKVTRNTDGVGFQDSGDLACPSVQTVPFPCSASSGCVYMTLTLSCSAS